MNRAVSAAHLLRRHLGDRPAPRVLLAVIVAVLAFLSVLTPLFASGVGDATIRYRLDALPPVNRDVAATSVGAPMPSSGASDSIPAEDAATWGGFAAGLEALHEDMPEPLRSLLGPAQYVVRFGNPSPKAGTTYVALDPTWETRVRMVDGRAPRFDDQAREESPDTAPPLEIALSAESAEEVGWRIGETRTVGGEAKWQVDQPLVLVGTWAAVDPDDPYWSRLTGTVAPTTLFTSDGTPFVRTTGFVAPGALQQLAPVSTNASTQAWFPTRPEVATDADAELLAAQLRAFTSTAQTIGTTGQRLTFGGSAMATLDAAAQESGALRSVLRLLLAGPAGAAMVVLVLACRTASERRRTALAVFSARGVEPKTLRLLAAVDGAVTGIAPAVIGAALGIAVAAVIGGGAVTGAVAWGPVLLAATPAIALFATAPLHEHGGRRAPSARRAALRRVLELIVPGVAALATVALLTRGPRPGDDTALLEVLAPLALAFLVCIATVRLYPLILGTVVARARRRVGYTVFLGAARALRDRSVGALPVFTLVVGVAAALASTVVLSTIQLGAIDSARASVGAELRLDSTRFDEGAASEIRELQGVGQVVTVDRGLSIAVSGPGGRILTDVYFADLAQLAQVQSGYPAVVDSGAAADLAAPGDTVPVLLSERIAQTVGASGAMHVGQADAVAAGETADLVPFSRTASWVLADASRAEAITSAPTQTVVMLLRLNDGASADEVAATIRDRLGPSVRTTTTSNAVDALLATPAASGMRGMLLAALVVSAALAALGLWLTLLLSAPDRRATAAMLGALGARRGAETRLLAWELGPPLLAAIVSGGLFGALFPVLVGGVVDLRPFTGGPRQPAWALDPILLAGFAGALATSAALLVGVGLAASVYRRRRARRIIEELRP